MVNKPRIRRRRLLAEVLACLTWLGLAVLAAAAHSTTAIQAASVTAAGLGLAVAVRAPINRSRR
jgi:hypothetical protein